MGKWGGVDVVGIVSNINTSSAPVIRLVAARSRLIVKVKYSSEDKIAREADTY